VTVRPVTLRLQDDQRTVIATGLQAGEQVVTTGFARIAEGTLVEPSSAEAAGQISATPPTGPQRNGNRPKRGADRGKATQGSGAQTSTTQ
jgi:multidrug efflux system membrane fusion protein